MIKQKPIMKPYRLLINRVWRTYSGGKYLEQWQGNDQPEDGSFPEEWVASTVRAFNVGRESLVEGLSELIVDNNLRITLKDLISAHPERVLGRDHVLKYGTETSVLVKVLDASERLTIQVHPDRDFAKTEFRSNFGKTEAWYILGGRSIDGEEPYVLFGFKPGVTKEQWRDLFEKQDFPGMINALHRIPVRAGDVFLVEGGVPHAIGSGCFLIEVQEPTDYTLRVERTTPKGNSIPDLACHQGLGFEKMLEAFHYETFSLEETMQKWKKQQSVKVKEAGGTEYVLISSEHTDRFRMNLLEISKEFVLRTTGSFCIAIVLSGSGKIKYSGNEQEIKQSEELFLPAGLEEVIWENKGSDLMKVILCYPPS
jgi:mannose-6-phosphate isomerase